MSERALLFYGERPDSVLSLRPLLPEPIDSSIGEDALANPSEDLAGDLLTGLLPKGPAWGTPDNTALDQGSVIARFWRSVGAGLAAAYSALYRVTLESTAVTLIDSLGDWEIDYGLPDRCFLGEQTRPERYRNLLLKIRSLGTITPTDFIDLAASVGYQISIEEPNAFECGRSDCGGSDEIGLAINYHWIVKVGAVPLDYFECGDGECGITPLLDFPTAQTLECLFRAIAPAWTRPIFDYS